MWKLLPIFIIASLGTIISESQSVYEIDKLGVKKYVKKEKIIFFLMAFSMAFYVGLRFKGNDTDTYLYMYRSIIPSWGALKGIDWTRISEAPGFQFTYFSMKALGISEQNFLMIFSLFTVVTYLWFIKKYTTNLSYSVYLFITMGVYTFTMAAIKQTTAVAILLIATDMAIRNKKILFILFILSAELFHPYAFIYLVVPLLFFKPWSTGTYWVLVLTIVISISLRSLLGSILAITDAMGGNYSRNEFMGEGVNIFRVMVSWVPFVLSYFVKDKIDELNDRKLNLIVNLSMICAVIMFIGIFGTANYFARLANYFLIFQTLALPFIIQLYDVDTRNILTYGSYIAYALYFVYEAVLANGRFDDVYGFIPMSKYFQAAF